MDKSLGEYKHENERLLANIARLLNVIGISGTCKGCGAAIWWVRHPNGKVAPYTCAALNHFADCPAAKQFKKDQ